MEALLIDEEEKIDKKEDKFRKLPTDFSAT